MITGTTAPVTAGTPISVTVGAGGLRGGPSYATVGSQGGTSSFGPSYPTTGGGYGGGVGTGSPNGTGGAGGSGGGASTDLPGVSSGNGGAGTPGQGSNGGSGMEKWYWNSSHIPPNK
jgi:hypothetical protein